MSVGKPSTKVFGNRFLYRGVRSGPLVGPLIAALALLSACGQRFSSCSDRRSCSEDSGGAGGDAGAANDGAGHSNGGDGGGTGSLCGGDCDGAETCCDGECVDTSSDSANCGACGVTCAADHGVAACVDSECSITRCDDGFIDCGGYEDGCETPDQGLPGAPSTVLPMAGTYTGAVRAERSLKPKFEWRAPEKLGSCGAPTYELELTRECVAGSLQECPFEEPEVREVGLTEKEWTPSEPLPVSEVVPVGALYAWRVRACDAPERCSEWSRVSYVNVGRLIDDVNADGHSDLVEVGNGNTSAGTFFAGDGATPLAASAPLGAELGSPTEGRFLGDVNGDAFPDLLLWAGNTNTSEPPRVILGAATPGGLGNLPMSAPLQSLHSGGRAGDLDGDGFADLAIAEFERAGDDASPQGVVRVYRGHSAFTLSAPVNLLPPEGTTAAQFGAALAGGFDSNADGLADLFILDDDEGLLHVVRGASPFSEAIAGSIEATDLVNVDSSRPSELLALGDRNGDGYGDLAAFVGNAADDVDNSVIQIFLGGAELAPEPAASVVVDASDGLEWVGGNDFGADGRADLFMLLQYSFGSSSGFQGRLRALPGSSEEQTASDLVQVGDFGEPLANHNGLAGGDYDGDGVLDLTIQLPAAQRRLLRGGKVAATSASCLQPAPSFPLTGNWCSVESSTFSLPDGYHREPVR